MRDSWGSSAEYLGLERAVVRQCGTSTEVLVEHGEAQSSCVVQNIPHFQICTVVLTKVELFFPLSV